LLQSVCGFSSGLVSFTTPLPPHWLGCSTTLLESEYVNFEAITFDMIMNAEPEIKCPFKQFQSTKMIGSLNLKMPLVSTP
jgi:hypothetical protein